MTATTLGDLLLGKTLRDGRRIELRIVPQSDDPGTLAYWISIRWPGRSGQTFTASPYQPATAPAPGVTHAIRVPGPDGEWVNLGLTSAEASLISGGADAWVQARLDRKNTERAATETAARSAAPGAKTWTIPDAYGYLTAIGQAARLHDGSAVTALSYSSTFYKEDGFSYGAAEDAGWVYFTEVREATPAEAAALETREAKTAAGQSLAARGTALASEAGAETPEDAPASIRDLPGARIEPERTATLAYGAEGCYRHLRADIDSGWLWVLTWNGADGDDWSHSNSGPYIARRLPLTPERRELFDALTAEFGAIKASND
jgi:hypothetical protein